MFLLGGSIVVSILGNIFDAFIFMYIVTLYLGVALCVPVEVLNQSELQESLLEMSKMTAEELAAYSKVQLLLEKIAKPQIKTEFPLIPNANARAPTQPMQAPSAKPYPSPLRNINAPLKRQPNTYRPQQVQPNTQQFYQRRQQPQRIPPKYTSSPYVHIKQKSSYNIPRE